MFCFVMKLLAKLTLEITPKTVTYLPGTFVTLDSGPYTFRKRGVNEFSLLVQNEVWGSSNKPTRFHDWKLGEVLHSIFYLFKTC